jgi:5-methylcytosine-specific restriction endonuclease McrA
MRRSTADPVKARTRQMHDTLKRRAGGQEILTLDELRGMFEHYVGRLARCPYCGVLLTHANVSLDHKVPVARGGWNTAANIEFICMACNKAKGNRTDEEFTDIVKALDEIGIRRRNPKLRAEILGDLMRAASFKFGANRRAKKR